jgi:hypothetical protein
LPPCDDDDDVLDEHNRRRHTSLPPTASGEESAMSRECHEYVPGLIAGGTRMKRKGAEGVGSGEEAMVQWTFPS